MRISHHFSGEHHKMQKKKSHFHFKCNVDSFEFDRFGQRPMCNVHNVFKHAAKPRDHRENTDFHSFIQRVTRFPLKFALALEWSERFCSRLISFVNTFFDIDLYR